MIDKKEEYLVSVVFRYTVTGECRVTQSLMIYGLRNIAHFTFYPLVNQHFSSHYQIHEVQI